MVCTVAQSFEPTFPRELWNGYQGTCDNMPKPDNTGEGFHNAIECLVTNMHPSVWRLTALLRKEDIVAKKEKVWGAWLAQ